MQKADIEKKIVEIEAAMGAADFWNDKEEAQAALKEYQTLKQQLTGAAGYDSGGAIVSVISGAGGDALFYQSRADLAVTDYASRHGIRPQLWQVALDAARIERRSIWPLLRAALRRMGRADLIGNSKKHLVPTWQPAGTGINPEGKRAKASTFRTQHTGLPSTP